MDGHRAIEGLVYSYAKFVDEANWDGLRALFAHAEIRVHGTGQVVRGGDEIASFWSSVNKVHADGTLRTRHLITNVIIDLDDELGSATAESFFLSFQATDRISLQPIAGGRYLDTFRCRDGDWTFATKDIYVDQVGDTSDNVTVDLSPEAQPRGSGEQPGDPLGPGIVGAK
jgi:3-phenylpropionate/cinnamic acid dioxygenase small subunit